MKFRRFGSIGENLDKLFPDLCIPHSKIRQKISMLGALVNRFNYNLSVDKKLSDCVYCDKNCSGSVGTDNLFNVREVSDYMFMHCHFTRNIAKEGGGRGNLGFLP